MKKFGIFIRKFAKKTWTKLTIQETRENGLHFLWHFLSKENEFILSKQWKTVCWFYKIESCLKQHTWIIYSILNNILSDHVRLQWLPMITETKAYHITSYKFSFIDSDYTDELIRWKKMYTRRDKNTKSITLLLFFVGLFNHEFQKKCSCEFFVCLFWCRKEQISSMQIRSVVSNWSRHAQNH